MMRNHCMDCKYFEERHGHRMGYCKLYGNMVIPSSSCNGYREKSDIPCNDEMLELKARIEKLERLVYKLI